MKAIWRGAVAMRTALITTIGFLSVCTSQALAQSDNLNTATQKHELSAEQSELLAIVRNSTERFKNVTAADNEQYKLLFGCVTGPDSGAMGLHFVKQEFLDNPPMLPNGEIDPTRPEIVIYEPVPGGGLRLIGADYLLFAAAWDKNHPAHTPQLMGQLFITSRLPTASESRRFTPCTCGRGKRTPTAFS